MDIPDISGYRTAANQDIIDNRHTAGILLARQEAATADGKAVAAQEDADNALLGLGDKQATLTALADVPGLQAALDAKQATPVAIADVTGLQAALDATPTPTIADPVIEPSYWVDTGDARAFTVHFDAAALALAGASKVRLTIQGISVTVNVAANQHTYNFAFNAQNSLTISTAIQAAQTVRADTFVLDSGDAQLYHTIGILRVVADEPNTPLPVNLVDRNVGARTSFNINWSRIGQLPAANFTQGEIWLFGWLVKIQNNAANDHIKIGIYNKDGTRDRELLQPSFPDGVVEYSGSAPLLISGGNGNMQLGVTSTTQTARNVDDNIFWAIKLVER